MPLSHHNPDTPEPTTVRSPLQYYRQPINTSHGRQPSAHSTTHLHNVVHAVRSANAFNQGACMMEVFGGLLERVLANSFKSLEERHIKHAAGHGQLHERFSTSTRLKVASSACRPWGLTGVWGQKGPSRMEAFSFSGGERGHNAWAATELFGQDSPRWCHTSAM